MTTEKAPAKPYHHASPMRDMSKKVVEHYTESAPMADEQPNFFPYTVILGLSMGVMIGALVGLLVGYLLREFIIVIEGMENLFSMEYWTFIFFFTMLGAATGIFFIGIGAILFAPIPEPVHDKEAKNEVMSSPLIDKKEPIVVTEQNGKEANSKSQSIGGK